MFTIKTVPTESNQTIHQIQADDIDIEFSKILTEYIKNIMHQNSQRAKSIFTNDFFSITFDYKSILELKKTQNESPPQTSRHTTVTQEIYLFAKLLDTSRENLTSTEISQKMKHDLKGCFTRIVHN